MSAARSWSGVVRYRTCVYVFGGNVYAPLTSSEKFCGLSKTWSAVPDMISGKAAFSPCAYRNKIYLACAAIFECHFEVFTPSTEKFEALPMAIRTGAIGSVAFVVEDVILILTNDRTLFRWSVETAILTKMRMNSGIAKWSVSNIPPVTAGTSVYWVEYFNGRMIEFDLETNDVTNR